MSVSSVKGDKTKSTQSTLQYSASKKSPKSNEKPSPLMKRNQSQDEYLIKHARQRDQDFFVKRQQDQEIVFQTEVQD